jgi:DNA-binding IclR family transcriptional regulator
MTAFVFGAEENISSWYLGLIKMPRTRATEGLAKRSPTPTYASPALDKGLDIIELLAHQSAGLTKSQLARELKRTVSEIFRMLVCLERRGYIAQVEEERYSLTLKMFKLVQEHPPTERLIADALPVMNRLTHETLQSCHMGVLEGGRIVIVAQVNAPTDIGFFVKLGSTVDLMEAGSGYVILAHQLPVQRERTLAEWGRETGKNPPRDLDVHLERIRRAGYEKRASYLVKGIVNVSFPIFDDRGIPLGALTVPHIQYNESAKSSIQVIERLREAAERITNSIGGKRPAA